MFGFELSDDTLLKVSGISALACCTFAAAAPRETINPMFWVGQTCMGIIGGAGVKLGQACGLLFASRLCVPPDIF
jgi:hypothetical protein